MTVLSSRYEAAHKTPKGPGDARPTALDIVKDNNMTDALAGKTSKFSDLVTLLIRRNSQSFNHQR